MRTTPTSDLTPGRCAARFSMHITARLARSLSLPPMVLVACARDTATPASDPAPPAPATVSPSQAETLALRPPEGASRHGGRRGARLSPLADSIARRLVFAPRTESWFTAASRGKRMLLDLGRVDADLKGADERRMAAYREAVASRSPVRIGARFRLHGPWGADDATVSGYGWWNGRIVATLESSPIVDSLARLRDQLPALAARTDTTAPSVRTGCVRDSLPPALQLRADGVRDSLEVELRTRAMPSHTDLAVTALVTHSRVVGCFAVGRAVLVATLRAGGYQHVRERLVAIDSAGAVRPLRLGERREQAHEAIYALDADADGYDDLAVRATRAGGGALVVYKVGMEGRLDRLSSGFVWER